jgi:tripartite-type tricarboxylate transporter receptor subunit TctC
MATTLSRRGLLAAGATLAALPAQAQAQPWRPTRSVTLILPFGAGSGTDAISRILSGLLEPIWGQPVVIENRAGANGALAASATARAAPDGMTLMMTTNTPSAANPALIKKLDYDPVADFTAICRTGNYNFWLVVPESSPFRTVADLLAAAKAKPGQLTYASGNSTGIVAGGAIAAQAGVEMTHVPYRSTPPAITDVVAGRVSCMVVDASSSMGNVKGGQLRVLGVTTKQRSKLLPEIPPLAELGLPGFDVAAWAGLIGPARMPPAMVASINADVRSVWDRPETVKRLGDIGFDGFSSTPEEFGGFIKDEIVKWGRMARAAGIEPE